METNDKIQTGIAIAAIVVGTAIVAACFIKVNKILKKDNALWAETPTDQK